MRFNYYAMGKKKAPCKDCKERHENCHSECEAYLEYNADREQIRKRKQAAIDEYEIQRKKRRK